MQQSQLVTEFRKSFKDAIETQQLYHRARETADQLTKDFSKFSSSNPPNVNKLDFNQVQHSISSLSKLGEQLSQQQKHYHQLTQKLEQVEKEEKQKKTKLIIFAILALWVVYLVF